MTTHVLITGGAGFIGSTLTREHLTLGHHVTILDNLLTGHEHNLPTHPRLNLIRHDVTNPYPPNLPTPQLIYNLASPASPPTYQLNPIHTWKTNTLGALHAAQYAHDTGATLIQASTSETYGDPTQHPQTETYNGNVNTTGPRACYDESKRAAETLLADYHRTRNTNIKIARIFNTYGPHMHPRDGRVITNFITQALTNEPITIYGDGTQTRSFCYITDLTRALRALALTPHAFTGPINLGNPTDTSITELAHVIRDLTHSTSRITHEPLPTHDPRRRRPDITLARSVLNWQPRVSLTEGLALTIDHLKRETPLTPGRTHEAVG